MADFSFIRDERFRASLESDYVEMTTAASGGAWKAVHVLAGSVVEAVLIDYLMDTPNASRSKKDPLKFELGEAIDLCHSENVLSDKTAALCHVIRSFRNLIHPGRVARLAETVDEQSGRVAIALTEMVVADVGRGRALKVGYTAEQLATKLEGDPSASQILTHLVPRLSKSELEKLLLKVLPDRYKAVIQIWNPSEPYPRALRAAYRAALDAADEPLVRKAAAWYATIVREASQEDVQGYQEAFFRATDLEAYDDEDRLLVIDHLLSRMRRDRNEDLIEAAAGVGTWLTTSQASTAVDVAVHEIVHGKDERLDELAREWVLQVFEDSPEDRRKEMTRRHGAWVEFYRSKGEPETPDISGLLDVLDDLPF